MNELEWLVDFHKDGVRQGPGSTAETLKAWELTGKPRSGYLKIADIGCGTGAQTLDHPFKSRGTGGVLDNRVP